jgi:hypothetical protein
MVPVDSRRVPRVPRYLGATRKRIAISNTGLSPSTAGLSRPFSYRFPIPRLGWRSQKPEVSSQNRGTLPTSDSLLLTSGSSRLLWSCNPKLTFRFAWFRLFRVRSPLLSESRLFSLPLGTEMVHFPRFAPYAYVFSAW